MARRTVLLWAVLLGVGLSNTPAISQGDESAARLTPQEFPILAWSFTTWGLTPPDLNAFKDIRECGFNVAGFVTPEQLDLVNRAGLQAIVSEESVQVSDANAALSQEEVRQRVAGLTGRLGGPSKRPRIDRPSRR